MDFGTLSQNGESDTLYAAEYFTVVVYPSVNGGQWQLTQSADALTDSSTGETLPAGACVVGVWQSDHNGQAFPSGSQAGTRGSFVATDKLLFRSNTNGDYSSVAATYAITDSPSNGATEFIDGNQRAGTYTSQVTIQLTLAA